MYFNQIMKYLCSLYSIATIYNNYVCKLCDCLFIFCVVKVSGHGVAEPVAAGEGVHLEARPVAGHARVDGARLLVHHEHVAVRTWTVYYLVYAIRKTKWTLMPQEFYIF